MAKKTIQNIGTIDVSDGKSLVVNAEKIIQAIGTNKKVVNAVLMLKGINFLHNCKVTTSCGCANEKTIDCLNSGKIGGICIACVNVTHEIDCILKNAAAEIVFKFERFVSCNSIDLKLEYVPQQVMHQNNAYVDVTAGGVGKGKVNLATGALQFAAGGLTHNSWQAGKQTVEIDDAEGGARSFDTHCGKGWKLGIAQYLVKRNSDGMEVYTYVDGDGNYHEFTEKYYYLNNKTKVYVDKADVTTDLNGKLTYSGKEVKMERRSPDGLTLETDYSEFKGGKLIEQRQDEQIELEEKVDAYKNQLKQYVVVYKFNGETVSSAKAEDGELCCDEHFAEKVSSSELLLTESEAVQYNSLLLQQTQELAGVGRFVRAELPQNTGSDNPTVKLLINLKENLHSLRSELYTLTKKENVSTKEGEYDYQYSKYLDYLTRHKYYDDPNMKIFNCCINLESLTDTGNLTIINAEKSESQKKDNIDALDVPYKHINGKLCDLQSELECLNDDLDAFYHKQTYGYKMSIAQDENNPAADGSGNYVKQTYDKTLTARLKVFKTRQKVLEKRLRVFQKEFNGQVDHIQTQISELDTIINDYLTEEQGKLINQQIQMLIDRSEINKADYTKYYKQYVNCVNQLETLYAQLPTHYITSGDNVLGFNKFGQFVATFDNYENQTAIIYEDGKIVAVRDTDNHETSFAYNSNGLLEKIVDADEKITSFRYDETDKNLLLEIVAPNGESVTFTYCTEGHTLHTGATCNNCELKTVTNNFGRGAEFVYDNYCRVTAVNKRSDIYSVDENMVLKEDAVQSKPLVTINYKSATTAVATDGNGVVTTYIFDQLGKPVTVYKGEYEDIGNTTKSVSLEYVDGKQSYSIQEDVSATNLLAAETAQSTLEQIDSERTLKYVLDKSKFENGVTDYVFSAWVRADSAYVPDAKYVDTDSAQYLDQQQANRKFELRAVVNYDRGEPDTYRATFDWLNTDWQFLTLPVEIDTESDVGDRLPTKFPFSVGDEPRNLVNVELYVDYSYNLGEIETDCIALRKGNWTYSTFDEDGKKLTDEDSSTKSVTEYIYDDKDRVVKQLLTDRYHNKYTSTYEYNKQGALIRSTNYAGVVEETVYDEKGRELKKITYNVDDPTSKLYQESKRDEKGVVTADIDESGLYDSTTYTYDHNGEVSVQTDGKGNSTAFGYKDGNLVSISGSVDGEESANTIHYNAGLLTEVSNGDTIYNYTYDGWDRTAKVEIAGAEYASTEYPTDLKAITKLADGTTQTSEQDEYGNVRSQITTFADGATESIITEYNDLQKPTNIAVDTGNGNGYNITYTYDKNKVVGETRDGAYALSKQYAYTADGDLEKTTYTVDGEDFAYIYETDHTPDKRNSKVSLPFGVEQRFAYDGLGRTKEIALGDKLVKDIHYAKYGDHATNRVSTVWYGVNGVRKDNTHYTYDKAGNIETVTDNGKLVARYAYDSLNRLVREDNVHFGTHTYRYDTAGNIIARADYAYTLSDQLGAPVEEKDYTYKQTGWRDQLQSYGAEHCAYDVIGNPTTYRDRTLTWQGRRLLSYAKDGKAATFTYDANGVRTSKVISQNGVAVSSSKYIYDGNNLVAEQRNGSWLHYLYGVDGVVGFNYNGTTYLFRKNVQGDVTHIYTVDGTLVAEYAYDAWGNMQILQDRDGIATLNPFRYRSYFFDNESGLYYLQTRYYDPETGRFINADALEYLDPETLGGLNLYAYCGNNPVMAVDPEGTKLKWWQKLLIGIAFIVVGALVTALTCGTGTGFMAAFGAALVTSLKAVIISTAVSAGIGALVGGIESKSWEGAWQGFTNGLVDGFMWGGIFAGGAQILSGAFKGIAQVANKFGKLQSLKKSPIFSPDRLKGVSEIAKIAQKGQKFYDYGGTIIRFSKNFHLDVSTKSLLHLAVLGFNHIPIGTILAGIIGGFSWKSNK